MPGKTEHNEFVRCNWALPGYVSSLVLVSVFILELLVFDLKRYPVSK